MKRLLPFLSTLFILIASSETTYAIQLGEKDKKTELEIEMYEFWHNTYLGLEEDKSGGFDIHKRANRKIFEQTIKSYTNPAWGQYPFASDSASTRGLVIISISRYPNGRIKEITAKYIHKSPRYERTRSFIEGGIMSRPNLIIKVSQNDGK